MLNFFKDYEKVNPTPTPPPAPAPKTGEALAAENIDDLKAYMESMKEGILQEVRNEMSKITQSQKSEASVQSDDIENNDDNNEGGN
jgi:hypothetical protein